MGQSKPTVSPAVVVLVFGWSGILAIIAASLTVKWGGPDYAVHAASIATFGGYLLGVATKRPGDISLTTNLDDAK